MKIEQTGWPWHLKDVHRPGYNTIRLLSVFLMLALWGVAMNRCAIAGWVGQRQLMHTQAHSCCAGASTEHDSPAPDASTAECCQKVLSLSHDSTAVAPQAPVWSVLVNVAWLSVVLVPESESAQDCRREVDPPERLSFAEVVLQGSLLSHAPPAAV